METFDFLKISLFVISGFQLIIGGDEQCSNITSGKATGVIEYYPQPLTLNDRSMRECTWYFNPPESSPGTVYPFVFRIQFTHIENYGEDDQIELPDGEILPKQARLKGAVPICQTYTFLEIISVECAQLLSERYCPSAKLQSANYPLMIKIETFPRSVLYSNLFYFTNLQMVYTLHLCSDEFAGILPASYRNDTQEYIENGLAHSKIVITERTTTTSIILLILTITALVLIAFLIYWMRILLKMYDIENQAKQIKSEIKRENEFNKQNSKITSSKENVSNDSASTTA